MNIDWFTFVAQIVNFLVLVALLRWFLYGPIVRAMQQREQKIAAEVLQAEQSQQEAEALTQKYEQKLRDLEEQRDAMLKNARHEVEVQRKQLLQNAREEVHRKRLDWLQAFEREREDVLLELRHRAGHMSVETGRRALAELAHESLEERIFATFTSRLHELDGERRKEIKSILGKGNDEVSIRSAFEITDSWKERLIATVTDEFEYRGGVNFELSPNLICGLELDVGGYAFGWNVNEFLENLETELEARLKTTSESMR